MSVIRQALNKSMYFLIPENLKPMLKNYETAVRLPVIPEHKHDVSGVG